MIERLFAMSGHLSTALMAYGVAALWLHPDSWWAAAVVYVGLVVLMLTPVTRVVVASKAAGAAASDAGVKLAVMVMGSDMIVQSPLK